MWSWKGCGWRMCRARRSSIRCCRSLMRRRRNWCVATMRRSCSKIATVNEHEPNDDLKSVASAVGVPVAFQGIIEKPGDADFFRFTANKGQQLDFQVYARKPMRSPLDALLTVFNAQGGTVGGNDDTRGPDSFARVQIPADGEYLISVRDQM